MQEDYAVFRSFTDAGFAREMAKALAAQNIPFQLENTSSPMDPLIIGNGLDADIRLKIRARDFEEAQRILEDYYRRQLDTIDGDYYLFGFTDNELIDVVSKPDEWGELDYLLAQKILSDRGMEVDRQTLVSLKEERLQAIAKPEAVEKSWIFWGYFIAVLFGPVGIFFGLTLLTLKKTLPNGQRVYSYSEGARGHGRNILVIASALTALLLLAKIISTR